MAISDEQAAREADYRSKLGAAMNKAAQHKVFKPAVDSLVTANRSLQPRQKVAASRWYRDMAGHATELAKGHDPGVLVPHPDPDAAEHGIFHRSPQYSHPSETMNLWGKNRQADSDWHHQQLANSIGEGKRYAETGTHSLMNENELNAANANKRFYAQHADEVEKHIAGIAATSEGMDYLKNPKAASGFARMSETQLGNVVKANRSVQAATKNKTAAGRLEKAGDMEGAAALRAKQDELDAAAEKAKDTANRPVKGTPSNQLYTNAKEKAARIYSGEHYSKVLAPGRKQEHFTNDAIAELNPSHPASWERRESEGPKAELGGMTGTHDHIMGVGVVKAAGGKDVGWDTKKQEAEYKKLGVPNVGTKAGFDLGNAVIREAARQIGEPARVTQAGGWIAEKDQGLDFDKPNSLGGKGRHSKPKGFSSEQHQAALAAKASGKGGEYVPESFGHAMERHNKLNKTQFTSLTDMATPEQRQAHADVVARQKADRAAKRARGEYVGGAQNFSPERMAAERKLAENPEIGILPGGRSPLQRGSTRGTGRLTNEG